MPKACYNPSLDYLLENDRKGRQSRRRSHHGNARHGCGRMHFCRAMMLGRLTQRALQELCAHLSILFKTTLIERHIS